MAAFRASVLLFLVCTTLFVEQVTAQGNSFLRKVSIREVEVDLQATLSELFQGTSALASRRIEAIERRTSHTFQAMPKNAAGRLAPAAVRYIVHDYFAREHGWLINGLEPHGMSLNITQMQNVNILMDKAPLLIEGLLEARQNDRGLSFNDIVTMAAVLEQMMFDDSVTLLQAAYRLNKLSTADHLDAPALHLVLQSYVMLFGLGSHANLEDIDYRKAMVELQMNKDAQEFEHDIVLNYEFAQRHKANPFRPRLYSFQDASEIMEVLAQQYGKWQNAECRDMRAHLMELDPEGLGQVPLGLFYGQPKNSKFHFSESADYLRQIGALDETTPGSPQVYISNYVTGPSNCIASSSYYSVCCMSECAEILAELEHFVAAPTATPEKLLSSIAKVSDKTLKPGLHAKLEAIAARHGGEVPLHGRLFAQWLHFAFPHECPYPTLVQSSAALSASQWLDGKSMASEAEREQHLASPSSGLAPSAEAFDIEGRWSDQEVLPVHEQPRGPSFEIGGAVRVVVQLVAVCVALRSALAAFRGVAGASGSDKASKKDDDLVLGFRV